MTPLFLSMLGVSVGLSIACASAAAQTFYAPQYEDVSRIHGSLAGPHVTVWLTLHQARAGYRFQARLDGTGDPSLIYWSAVGSPSFIRRTGCEVPQLGDRTGSCRVAWPQGMSAADFTDMLARVGALPLPARVSLTEMRLPPPCPDDGYHLWIVLTEERTEEEIEFCNYEYRWADRDAPYRVIEALEVLLSRARDNP